MYVNHTTDYFSGAKQFHQLTRTVYRIERHVRVQSFFVFRGSLRAHTKLFRRHAHRRTVKVRALKQDCRRVVLHLGVERAHHARNRDCARFVRNDEHRVVEHAIHLVERRNLLSVFCAAHDNMRAGQVAQIKCVHRLAVL